MTESLKLIDGYLDENGRITRLPGKRQKKKLDIMIEYWASLFEREKDYSELEVNTLLNEHHSFNDPATLRRLLVGTGKLGRTIDGKRYWRV